ncbi:MAG: sigma-70 family RNA polymerase sigma factor [Anaerorhabdus sp.]|nr:sigma-70 family RNA polymerase sigma factor [Anaerorhabdus sp.]MEA4874942.1 sigma-70 family RNA polymerase sigma factor [Anaerorhabdus sp.]
MEQLNQSYEEIYQSYAKLVYGFLLKKCHRHDLAEDLTQETFVIALEKLDTYDHSCKISTWLCGIANNLLRQEFRKEKEIELNEDIITENIDWDCVDILKKVHELSEPYREVMYLRLTANLSFSQIGEIMDKSENWARVTFYRGKTRIKEAIEDETTM